MIYLVTDLQNSKCKIGYSNNPKKRFGSLQTGHPNELYLEYIMDGSREDEKLLHQKFSKYHYRGEWFNHTQEIVDYFSSNAKLGFPEGYTSIVSTGYVYTNNNVMRFLLKSLTPIEFRAAMSLSHLSGKENVISGLNNRSTLNDYMRAFDVSINKVKPILSKLKDVGVYETIGNALILNPYLSFAGRLIESDVAELFKNTHCARAFYNEDYGKTI